MERGAAADVAQRGKAATARRSGAGGIRTDGCPYGRPLPSITDRLTIITLVFALIYMAGPDRGD